jgi:hypothetical protein
MAPALDRAERDGIDHQPRLEARLDCEKAADLLEHADSLTPQRLSRGFAPFRS